MKISTLTLNPAIDLVVGLDDLKPKIVNRTKTEDYQERFDVAARELLAQGYEVVNPAYEGTKLENASYEDYMRLSFQLLNDCDIIYMLKGWETSPGANQEFGYALAKAMEIRFEK